MFYDGLSGESKLVLDISVGGVFMSLTMKEGENLTQTIVTTRVQLYDEELTEFTPRKVYHVKDMEEFREVRIEKGEPT